MLQRSVLTAGATILLPTQQLQQLFNKKRTE
jgi:hypothetical protein